MTDLIRLAERVEALARPDREVDAEIGALLQCLAVGEESTTSKNIAASESDPGFVTDAGGRWCAPRYTASLDAAMTLVGNNWWNIEAGCDGTFFAKVLPWSVDCRGGAASNSATPALALTAASLRSIAAQRGQG